MNKIYPSSHLFNRNCSLTKTDIKSSKTSTSPENCFKKCVDSKKKAEEHSKKLFAVKNISKSEISFSPLIIKKNPPIAPEQVEKKLDQLTTSNFLTSEELSSIFEIENQIREILNSQHFSEKEKYLELYDQKIIPLVNKAKLSIKQRAFHYAVQAAANEGKGALTGFQALSENPKLINNVKSNNKVFLLPPKTVFKQTSVSQEVEEESQVRSIFDLKSKQAVVGAFTMQKLSAEKFGIPMPEEIRERGFIPENISPTLRRAIKGRLSGPDHIALTEHEITPPKKIEGMANYLEMEKQKWFLQFPKEKWKEVSLKDLQNLYLAEKLTEDTRIGLSRKTSISFQEHILKKTSFHQALNYFPTLKPHSRNLFLTPDLSDPQIKKSYEVCEQFKWTYINSQKLQQTVDFKTLHANFLQNQTMHLITPISSSSSSKKLPTTLDRDRAFNSKWKIIYPELMQLKDGLLSPVTNVQAKPFIEDMHLMEDFVLRGRAREALLQRLTPDAEYNAVITGILQLLDMHGRNLGVAPVSNSEYEKFKNMQFSIYPSETKIKFKDLIIEYLDGALYPERLISYEENGFTIKKPLRDLPDLQKALEVRWKFIIFDTGMALAEDNRWQLQILDGFKYQHHVPVRSTLLETNWKDKLLSEETIKQLLESDDQDLQVKNWVEKEDAPLNKRISKATKKYLDQKLTPIRNLYTLSELRKQNSDRVITVKLLQSKFVKRISNIDIPSMLEIWQRLEQDLSLITIRPNDTLEIIAERHHQSLNELKLLNPNLEFKPGQKIKIKYDLTSHSNEATKRRYRLAAQLFPRLTKRQQEALLERQYNLQTYLKSYKKLLHSTFQGEDLFFQIVQFVNNKETPISSIRRKQFVESLKENYDDFLKKPALLLDFKQKICLECQPTYFNLMKSMYPLLADFYELAKMIYNKSEAGAAVGSFTTPIEILIPFAKAKFNRLNTLQRELVLDLEKKIKHIKNPAFFIHLDSDKNNIKKEIPPRKNKLPVTPLSKNKSLGTFKSLKT